MNAILARLHSIIPAIPRKLSSGDINETILWTILAAYLLLHILVGRFSSSKGQSFWVASFWRCF